MCVIFRYKPHKQAQGVVEKGIPNDHKAWSEIEGESKRAMMGILSECQVSFSLVEPI
jgi:hypothetical protein